MINQLKEEIIKSKTIGIVSHKNPDGDSIGSVMGLYHVLKEIHPNVKVIKNDVIPKKFGFLQEKEDVLIYESGIAKELDLLFVLDCGHPARLVEGQDLIGDANRVINIDHHMNNPHFGHKNVIDTEISSTCELVYDLCRSMDLAVNEKSATAFYTGMVTDTGSFKYNNTTPKTLRTAADLLGLGVDKQKIYREVYQSRRMKEVHLLGEMLGKAEVLFDGRLAMASLSQEKMKSYDLTLQDLDELIDFLRDIEKVEVAVVLKEKEDGGCKIGFRSKGIYKVNQIAREMGGGGHEMAAGASVETSLEKTKEALLPLFENFF